ncbi:unnamed protein product [Caenorhabditis nigoni]
MFTEFLICFSLWTNVQAGVIPTSIPTSTTSGLATTTPEPFDEDAEIAKIRASCFHYRDFEQIADNVKQRILARTLGALLIHESLQVIGLTELRRKLNFSPFRPWQRPNYDAYFNESEPTTIEAYYDLKEPHSFVKIDDDEKWHENNLMAVVPYLDIRFPSIRTMFRRKFDKIFESCGKQVDKNTISHMIHCWFLLYRKLDEALTPRRDTRCWDDKLYDEPVSNHI